MILTAAGYIQCYSLTRVKKLFFWAFRINFQVLLLVVAFANISIFIFLRQSAFDSVWHFRKSVRNNFVKVWQVEKFHFETEHEENF